MKTMIWLQTIPADYFGRTKNILKFTVTEKLKVVFFFTGWGIPDELFGAQPTSTQFKRFAKAYDFLVQLLDLTIDNQTKRQSKLLKLSNICYQSY